MSVLYKVHSIVCGTDKHNMNVVLALDDDEKENGTNCLQSLPPPPAMKPFPSVLPPPPPLSVLCVNKCQIWSSFSTMLSFRAFRSFEGSNPACDSDNIVNGACSLLESISSSCPPDSWTKQPNLTSFLKGRYLLCVCLTLSCKFHSDEGLLCIPTSLGVIYRTAYLKLEKLSSVESDDFYLHDVLMQLELEVLCKQSGKMFRTMMNTQICYAENLLSCEANTVLRKLTGFFSLVFLLRKNSHTTTTNQNIDGETAVLLAVSCVDSATQLEKHIPFQSKQVPTHLRSAFHKQHKEIAISIACVLTCNMRGFPHVEKAQKDEQIGNYICVDVFRKLLTLL